MTDWVASAPGPKLRDHLITGVLCLPAVLAVLELSHSPSYEILLFGLGTELLTHNLSLVILAPYIFCFFVALGDLCLRSDHPSGNINRVDDILLRFFGGAALLIVLGFLLALSSALYAAVTASIFFVVLYLYFLRNLSYLWGGASIFRDWVAGGDLATQYSDTYPPYLRVSILMVRAVIVVVAGLLIIVRSAYVDVHISDIVQLYLPYLDEVRRQHSIWMDPAHPVYSDFLVGRGNGAHLFLTSFTSPYVTQVISLNYAFAAVLLLGQAAFRLCVARSLEGGIVAKAVRELIILLSLSVFFNPALTFAKYHMQTTALLLGVLYLLSQAIESPSRRVVLSLGLIVAAIPTTLPQYHAFSVLALGVGAIVILLKSAVGTGHRSGLWAFLKLVAGLFVVGSVACAVGLLINWAYIGVPELNPYWFFSKFINHGTFSKWASEDALVYTSYIQHIYPGLIQGADATAAVLPLELGDDVKDVTRAFINGGIGGIAFLLFTDAYRRARSGRSGVFPLAFICGQVLVVVALIYFSIDHYPRQNWPVWLKFSLHALYALLVVFLILHMLVRSVIRDERFPTGWTPFPFGSVCLALLFVVTVVVTRSLGYPSFTRLEGYLHVLAPLTILLIAVVLARSVGYLRVVIHLIKDRAPRNMKARTIQAFAVFMVLGCLGLFLVISNLRLGTTLRMVAAHVFVFGIGAGVAGVFWLKVRSEPEYGAGIARQLLVALACVAIVASAVFASRRALGGDTFDAISYVAGLKSRVTTINDPDWDFGRCMELREAVPANARVLHLNGYVRMSQCLFSPLLPRGKLVHHYESDFARQFGEIVLGAPRDAEAKLKELGIDYFLLDKGDILFWGPGLSEMFRRSNLVEAFEVYYESPRLVIITWRGAGKRPITEELADEIELWRGKIRSRAGKRLTPEYPFDLWGGLQRMREEGLKRHHVH
jgi:hypothetical protein